MLNEVENMSKRMLMMLPLALCVMLIPAVASAVVIPVEPLATFADPGTTSFMYDATTQLLTGGNPHVQLDILNGPDKLPGNVIEFLDASFFLTNDDGNALSLIGTPTFSSHTGLLLSATFGAGKLEFYDNTTGLLILGATFQSITLSSLAVGAKFSVTNDVHFYGPASFAYGDTAAAFSFALDAGGSSTAFQRTLKSFKASSSFSCSAEPLPPNIGKLPEPGTIILIGSGLCALTLVARRKFARA